MFKFIRRPAGILALTIAAPVLAQPAATTMPNPTSPPATTAPASKAEMIDLNSATATELKAVGSRPSSGCKIGVEFEVANG